MAATNKRAAFRAGVLTVLNDYKTDHTDPDAPEYLAHVADHPPGKVTGRYAFLQKGISETISFGNSIRQRVLTGTLTVTNHLTSNDQAADEQDALADALVDQFTEHSRSAVTGCVLLPAGINDREEGVDGESGIYAAFDLTLTLMVQEGRTI